MLHRLHLLGAGLLSPAAAHAEHLTKNVVHAVRTAAALLEALLAVFIVNVAFVLVTQDFVRGLQLLELLRVAATIGVVLEGEFPECLSDFVHSGRFLNAEERVELGVVDLLRGSASAAHFLKSAAHSTEWEAAAAKEHVSLNYTEL